MEHTPDPYRLIEPNAKTSVLQHDFLGFSRMTFIWTIRAFEARAFG
jgi:hypothetical protein